MILQPTRSTRNYTLFPDTTLSRSDGSAAGLPSIELGIEGLPGPPVGVIGEEGFAVDEVAQCTGLAAQVTDHVPEIDAMPPVGMTDPHTRRGHYPVWTEEELDAIVKEMRVEAPSDEAGRHRIGNPLDGDGAVAGDIDGEHGEIGGSPCGQRLESPAFCLDRRSMPPLLSGHLRLHELHPSTHEVHDTTAPPAYT